MGEAPARSSLVPRDLTAELCLMPLLRSGFLPVQGTPYGVFEFACSVLRFGSFLSYIHLTAFWFVVGWLFVPCLFRLCLV